MSWQEELRKLDEELAAGRISADDYRVRRDQVLSSAVSQGETAGQQQQSTGPQQQGERPAADSTQVISPIGQQGGIQQQAQPPQADSNQADASSSGDRQQSDLPSWHAQASTQGPQHQARPTSPASGFQQPPQQPWNAPEQDMTPPWGGSDFPPSSPGSNSQWASQGPEGFEPSPQSRKRRVLAVASAVVVLAAAIGVGAYFLFAPGDQGQVAQQTDRTTMNTEPAPTSKLPNDDLAIAPLPGDAHGVTKIKTFADVVTNGRLTEDENEIYQDAGAGKARLAISEMPSGMLLVVLTVEARSSEAASEAVDRLVELQKKYDMAPYPGSAPQQVHVQQIKQRDTNPAAIRTHYTHDDTIVRIDVAGDNLGKLDKLFKDVLSSQLKALPAVDDK